MSKIYLFLFLSMLCASCTPRPVVGGSNAHTPTLSGPTSTQEFPPIRVESTVMPPTAGPAFTVRVMEGVVRNPASSADGSTLAFWTDVPGNTDNVRLVFMDKNGRHETPLIVNVNEISLSTLAVSPHGDEVAFMRVYQLTSGELAATIRVYDRMGQMTAELRPDEVDYSRYGLRWKEGIEYISLMTSYAGKTYELMRWDGHATNATPIVSVYELYRYQRPFLYRDNVITKQNSELKITVPFLFDMAVSNNGTLAYASDDGIFIYTPQNGLIFCISDSLGLSLHWSSDSRYLAYISDDGVYVYDMAQESTIPTKVMNINDAYSVISWLDSWIVSSGSGSSIVSE